MSFRGISCEPIHPNIQLRLKELEAHHMHASVINGITLRPDKLSAGADDELGSIRRGLKNYKTLNSKTVWYSLRSNAVYPNADGEYVQPLFAKLGPKWDYAESARVTAEGGFQGSWKARTARPDKDNTPPPGVESINISTKGTLGSIKTADIKLRVYHPSDIEHIERAYLMPGITLFLEWGWSIGDDSTVPVGPISEKKYNSLKGKTAANDLESLILRKKLGLKSTGSIMSATKLSDIDAGSTLSRNPGQYDGMLGVITKFNWSMDQDGSYSIGISIISPNSLIMGSKLETHHLAASKNTGYYKKKGKYIAKTDKVKDDSGKTRKVPATTSTAISDAEFLCRGIQKLLKKKGKKIDMYPVENSLAIGNSIASLKKAIKNKEQEIKWFEEEMQYAKEDLESVKFTLQDVQTRAMGNPPYSLSWATVYEPNYQVLWRGNADPPTWDELESIVQRWVDDHEYWDKATREEKEPMIKEAKAIIANWEKQIEDLEEQENSERDAEPEPRRTRRDTTAGAYMVEGEGDQDTIYFAMDPMGLFEKMISDMGHVRMKSKIFGNSKYIDYYYAKKDKMHHRNGNYGKKYWWQTGETEVEEGALLATRGWKKKGKGQKNTEWVINEYVTWRWIEDYLLRLCGPQDENLEPIMSVSSTHIASETSMPDETVYFPNQCINHPIIQSMDPDVCMLYDKQSKEATDAMKPFLPASANNKFMANSDAKNGRFMPVGLEGKISTFGNYTTASIRDILVNVDHILKVLQSQRTFEGLITTLLSDINDACGKPWDFSLIANESDNHVLQVIDKRCIENRTGPVDQNPIILGKAGLTGLTNEITAKTFAEIQEEQKEITSGGLLMLAPAKPVTDPTMYAVQNFKAQDHFVFKGKGIGNILKSVSLNSKLPKAVASMAFISNKKLSTNTEDSDMHSFNIYGEDIGDNFYSGTLGTKRKTVEERRAEYVGSKNSQFEDWVNSYNQLFVRDSMPNKGTLNARQIQEKIVAKLVLGVAEQSPTENSSKLPRLLPLELKLSMDGISGIYQGNSLKMKTISEGGVLPDRYADKVIFQVTKVQQSISDSGWTTSLDCMMRMEPK